MEATSKNDPVKDKKGTKEGVAEEVILAVRSEEEEEASKQNKLEGLLEPENVKTTMQLSAFLSSPSPDISNCSSSSNKPPKIPSRNLTRRGSLARSTISKPKSRFVEDPAPIFSNHAEQNAQISHEQVHKSSPVSTHPRGEGVRTPPITPKTPLMASPGGDKEEEEEEEEEEIFKSENVPTAVEKARKKLRFFVLIEWVALVCILGWLAASLSVRKLQHVMFWGVEIWKWCVLAMVIVCGRLVTGWFVHVIVFSFEKNFLLRKKVLYFVYGLKNSVQICIWLGLVLLAWVLLINRGIKRSKNATKILNYVSRGMFFALDGAVIWLIKTLLMKILAASFHVNTFFDRIQESLFYQYVLQMLSGPPLMEIAERIGDTKNSGRLSFRNVKKGKGGEEQETIDVTKLQKMNQEKVSAWTMKGLINVIRTSGLSTISNTIDHIQYEGGILKDKEITSEWEAKAAAYQIFRNVAKPGSKYIEEEDLLRFLSKEDVDTVLRLFEGALETGKISNKALKNWVVKAYLDRKSLAHSLNDTKTAVKQLNKLVSVIVAVVMIIIGFLIMGFATIQVFAFITSQMLLVVFMFGNTAKSIFESIIFVFVMHPFDVGDRCVIDGVQMIVEEMNILTTVFLRYDNEKIYYPNVVLATKPISNFYRSPDMGDNVEFSVDVITSMESIGALKAKIKMYIESRPQHWRPNHQEFEQDENGTLCHPHNEPSKHG